MSEPFKNWEEWGVHVLAELERINREITGIEDNRIKVHILQTLIDGLKSANDSMKSSTENKLQCLRRDIRDIEKTVTDLRIYCEGNFKTLFVKCSLFGSIGGLVVALSAVLIQLLT